MLYAKSDPPESLKSHIRKCLENYEQLKREHPDLLSEKDWMILRLAVTHHDDGKIDPSFQKEMEEQIKGERHKRKRNRICHSFLSGAFLDREKLRRDCGLAKQDRNILFRSVYYHHARKEPEKEEIRDFIARIVTEERNCLSVIKPVTQ